MQIKIEDPQDCMFGIIALMTAIHIHDYDLLPCPECNEDLWYRILYAVETPLIDKYW